MAKIDSNDLQQVMTAEYRPTGFIRHYMPSAPHHRPIFNTWCIEQMMQDPRICFGLELIKGPIHAFTKFFSQEEADQESVHRLVVESDIRFPYVVRTDDKKIEEFIVKNIRRFWQNGAIKALNAIEWGYSGSEVMYKQEKKSSRSSKYLLHYDNLRDLDPRDLQVVTQGGGIVGIEIYPHKLNTRYIGIPKSFWHVHSREKNRYYGMSRLFGAYAAWWEIWGEGGARDIRRNWFHRNAFDGGIMYYPPGFSQQDDGTKITNRDLALEMLSKKRSGGYMLFPNQENNGKPAWMYEPPVAGVEPQGMQSYLGTLSDEELEGLGIPPEVVQGGASGLGSSSGREIPMIAYFSTLQKTVDFLIQDFQAQVLDYLIALNFRNLPYYEIVPLIPNRAFEDPEPNKSDLPKPKESKSEQKSESTDNETDE